MLIRELNAALYPWDLADEGVGTCLDSLTERTGANSVYLVGVMHKEKRPLTSMFYLHNPNRIFYLPEDSRLYYQRVDPAKFRHLPISPLFTEHDFLKGKDWLDILIREARSRGMKAGVEISHTFYDVEHARRQFPELLQQKPDGTRTGFYCLNNETVREYLRILFTETVAQYDVDYIQTCMRAFGYGEVPYTWHMEKAAVHPLRQLLGVALGTCFCDSCRRTAGELGYDWDFMYSQLSELYEIANVQYAETGKTIEQHLLLLSNLSEAALLLRYPGLYQWLEFRCRSVANAFAQLSAAVKAVKPQIDFRYNNDTHREDLAGLRYDMLRDHIDTLRVSDYIEQRGDIPESAYLEKKRNLFKAREGIGFQKKLLTTVAIRPNATPEIIRKSLMHLSETGIDGISLAHYDGSRTAHLDAVKQGMAEAGIVLRREEGEDRV